MTLLDDTRPTGDLDELKLGTAGAPAATGAPQLNLEDLPDEVDEESFDEQPPVKPTSVAIAGFLATAAVGWMLGGIFVGAAPRLIGIAGAAIGAGIVGISYKLRNPTIVQALALPLSIVAGIALLAPYTSGTTIPKLITGAINAGGLSQPPAPFDPGWRFLLIVLCCAISVAATTGAVAFNKSKIAVFLPAPVVGAGVLIQPKGHELLSVAPALAMVVGALAVAFGGELSRDGDTGGGFEVRRLGKAAGFLAVIVAAMFAVSQLGFLYPPTKDSTIVPPKRPQTPPAVKGNPLLFTVTQTENTPLRLGVLDSYDGTAWLTPPYDPKRYLPIKDDQLVPAFVTDRSTKGWDKPQAAPTGKTVTATITIDKPGEAREIPDLTGTVSEKGAPKGTTFDPRTQTLRLPGASKSGETYTVTAVAAPDGKALSATGTDPASLKEFLQVPTAPKAVQAILATAPTGGYERLQYVRTQFFKKITAAGAGNPVDVTPDRVQAFLTGTLATPYEITASEVLMARWAGFPARIGYGYYNPDAKADGTTKTDIHSSDGALWLEAYFPSSGWTPILGHPPKAQASLAQNKKKNDPSIRPNGLISAQLLIPIKQDQLSQLYTIVQFYLVRALGAAGVLFFFWIILPGMLKQLRRIRRRRWAERHGPREQIAVAYAEIRDRCIDFNFGHPSLTPLEFLDVLAPDEDHTRLAWLVTRGLWGDLSRHLRDTDVEAAELMSRALYKRLVAGQPFLTRVVAFGSRVSLKDPWERSMPNTYWSRSPLASMSGALRSLARGLRPRRVLRAIPGTPVLVLLVCVLLTSGCVQQLDLSNETPQPLPVVPATVAGFSFEPTEVANTQFAQYRKIALISNFRLYAIRQDKVVVGTLQTAAFKKGLQSENHEVREGVLNTLGGSPKVSKVAGELFYTVKVAALTDIIWFPKDGQSYQLLAGTQDLADPTALFARLIAVEEGKSASSVSTEQGAPPADTRRSAS